MRKLIPLCVFMLAAAFLEVSAQEKTSQPAAELQAANLAADEALAEEEAAIDDSGSAMNGIGGKLLMYIPNRIVDFLDIFSIELKSGAAIGAEFSITRAFGLGGEFGAYGSAVKGYNRQYGFALSEGVEAQAVSASYINLQRPVVYGNVERFWVQGSNFPCPSNRLYREKIRDYWAIELGAICLAGAKVSIHPVSLADFFTGLILLDLENDDYVLHPYAE
jgi:hypothetical protein